jgi:DNA-binding SARP family transcriptional activator
MEFRILGSLEVVERGRLVRGEHLPRTAQKALQGHVSALRKLLGPDRIRTQALGYLLRVEPGELDADRFESLIGDARSIADPLERCARLTSALSLWRGEALADFRYDDFAQAQSARLEELRINAMEERLEAQLALGRHAEVLSELERLVSAHPMRERLRGQQMLALFRAGRQSEALQVYREGRRRFAEELGIYPGPGLLLLELQILAQDPALAPP